MCLAPGGPGGRRLRSIMAELQGNDSGVCHDGRVAPEVRVASAAYQPEPKAAAAARRFVRDTLQAWVVTGAADGHGLVDDAVLLTSELVTNAVVHAGTPGQGTCRLPGGPVRGGGSERPTCRPGP